MRPAGFAQAGARLQELDLAAGQATIVNEVAADRTPGPPATEERDVTIQCPFAYGAAPRFDSQEHRLPLPTRKSYTHTVEYSEPRGQ